MSSPDADLAMILAIIEDYQDAISLPDVDRGRDAVTGVRAALRDKDAEIERLRRENEALGRGRTGWPEAEAVERELARLREGLSYRSEAWARALLADTEDGAA